MDFGVLVGLACAYAGGVGLICAVGGGGEGPTWWDSLNARNHWRGHLQVAGVMFVVGCFGQAVAALF